MWMSKIVDPYGAGKYLRHACDMAINEQAIVVCHGRSGVGKTRCLLE
jgi:ABC-type lipoprotein export system ATPase subunit